MSNIFEIQAVEQLHKLINECDIPIVVKFSAAFCAPCKAMQPKFEELAQKYVDKTVFVCVDIELLEDLADEYEVRSIPTMIVIREKLAIKRTVGGNLSAVKDIESAIVSII